MAVTVRVRGMTATLDGRSITIELTKRGDGRDVEALARALWAARTREVLDRAGLTREPPPIGWRAKEYTSRRAAIVACGRSADTEITVRGMRDWKVTGEIQQQRLQEAARDLMRDQERQIRALKRAIWRAP